MKAIAFKSKSTDGELAKTYIVIDEIEPNSVSIYQRFLTKTPDGRGIILKKFKDYYLYERAIAFKNESLFKIAQIVMDYDD